MNLAEYDDRCWHELPFAELAAEAAAIARRTGDTKLGELAEDLRIAERTVTADLVIDRIETHHAGY